MRQETTDTPKTGRIAHSRNTIVIRTCGIALILALAVAISACGVTQRESVTIAEASQPVFALVYIADANGYFDDEGLDVSFKSFTSARDALNSVIDRESDIATVYETPVVLKTYEGVNLGVITSLHTSNKNTGLVARRDRGIDVPEDLRGKTIAVTSGTNAEFFLSLFLSTIGINLSEVSLIDTKPEEMAGVLRDGSVDAVAIWNPNLYNARQSLPEEKLAIFFSDVYTEFSVLAGRRELVTERPKAMQALVKAVVKAEKFLEANPGEAIEIVIKRLSNQPETTIRGVWSEFRAEASTQST